MEMSRFGAGTRLQSPTVYERKGCGADSGQLSIQPVLGLTRRRRRPLIRFAVDLALLCRIKQKLQETILVYQHLDPYAPHENNPEHVALLRGGVAEWNANRPDHPQLARVDMAGADLAGIDLSYADLSDANLSGVNLAGAELHTADMRRANLSRGNLSKANLYLANLNGANLRGVALTRAGLAEARLIGADLGEANMTGANLYLAHLRGARLTGADVAGANFAGAIDADLMATVGVPLQQP